MSTRKKALSVARDGNFADWYQAVITAADMAEHSGVRGCMVIKPWGYRLWERVQSVLDGMIKATGHQNCYFPLFIPLELIQKEASHVEGFAKEMAVVTHHRLVSENGKLVPAAPLESPLIVRPTSETMIGESFANWIQSYRDLPLKLNQWANVVRWEMRPRLFLRTSEFLWQEGHTAHATREEAMDETKQMLEVYRTVAEDHLAIPVLPGIKSENERFPGADETWTIEAMMQDGRALQSGTSHFLGQNFARAANIQYQDKQGEKQFVFTTSWGLSTRIIGATIMTHGDDDGLRLPPRMAPDQIVIVPIIRDPEGADAVIAECQRLAAQLRQLRYADEPLRVFVDLRDDSSATKRWNWLKKGVPLVCELGPRDLEGRTMRVQPRNGLDDKPLFLGWDELPERIPAMLAEMQQAMFREAVEYRERLTRRDIATWDQFRDFFKDGSGFVEAPWSGDLSREDALRELGVTIRCLLPDQAPGGDCVLTGAAGKYRAVFAKAY